MTHGLSVSDQLDALYKIVLSYVNLEKISELQQQPNGIELVVKHVSKCTPSTAPTDIIKDLIEENVLGCEKDNLRASELREAANKTFASKEYGQAARIYSDALRYLSLTAEENLDASKILCNRALTLYRLGEYTKAEKDCSVALKYQCSNVKALYWRAMARYNIGNEPGFQADAQQCIDILGQHHADSGKLKDLLVVKACHTDQKKEKLVKDFQPNCERPQESELEKDVSSPLISDAQAILQQKRILITLKVQDTKELGRHIISREPVAEGTDLFEDLPFAHAMQKGYRLKHCATCLRSLSDQLIYWPCIRCASVVFCSLECRDKEEKFHKPGNEECGFAWPSVLPVETVLALRFARQMLCKGGPDLQHDQSIMGSLLHHFKNLSPEAAVFESLVALVLHALWLKAVAKSSCHSGVMISPESILLALCVIRINAMAITDSASSNRSRDGAVGLGIYPVASFLTHSCTPNVSIRFDGVRLTTRSVEKLPALSTLLHCYGPQSGEMTSRQRQMMLKHQYGFDCHCLACSHPPDTEMEMIGLACSTAKCRGAILPPCPLKAGLVSAHDLLYSEEEASCSTCGAMLDLMEWQNYIKPRLETAREAFTVSSTSVDGIEHCISQLQLSLNVRRSFLHMHNQLVGETHSRLAELYKLAGQLD